MILWRDAMSVGNSIIDADHRYLLCLINSVELALRSGQSRDVVTAVLDQLTEYTHYHFEREERVQLAMSYVHHDRHKASHRELLVELERIREQVAGETREDAPSAAIERLVELLRRWIMDHILKDDMLMKPLLSQLPSNFGA